MKKILRLNIIIPSDIDIILKNKIIYIKGFSGFNHLILLDNIYLYKNNDTLYLISTDLKNKKDFFLFFNLLRNKILGSSKSFFSQLECNGLGYKAKVENSSLVLKLGFSHKLSIKIPDGISTFCSKSNNIIFSSVKKDKLFEFVTKVKSFKKPDSYKGKGLIFKNENLKLKEGKKI